VRRSILTALEDAPGPINAQQVFDAVLLKAAKGDRRPDRVTVYRTLNALVDSGLAHRVDPGDRVFRFSLTDHAGCSHDHHVHEHPHFVCDDCGKVECLEGTQVIIRNETPTTDPARARRVRQSKTVLHGTCGQCDSPPASSTTPTPPARLRKA
jgi:Fur family ferric uptake transcriptional regulator